MTYEQKRETLEQLLDHWADYWEQASSGTLGKDDPDRPMPTNWTLLSSMSLHPSVVELVRCVELCRRMAPGHYRHLAGFYGAEWKNANGTRPGKTRSGKKTTVQCRVRVRVVPSWVNARMVDRSLDFVLGVWSGSVRLELPRALEAEMRQVKTDGGDGYTTEPRAAA